MTKKREIWIVEGIVTDPDAHDGVARISDTEWQFSDGPAGERGSSADYLSLEAGMRDHPNCIFHFDPEPEQSSYEFTAPNGQVWEIIYHRFAGWRGIKNNAATDDDVTVYCETAGDVIHELQGH